MEDTIAPCWCTTWLDQGLDCSGPVSYTHLALHLVFEGLGDGLLGLDDVGGGVESDALCVVGVGDLAEHLADLDRRAGPLLVAAVGAGCGFLAYERRRGHLTAGHAVDGIVYEDDGELFTPVSGVDYLVRADGGEVAVALVGEHAGVGVDSLDAGGDGGSPAVRGLVHIAVEVVIRKDGAADRRDADDVIRKNQFRCV